MKYLIFLLAISFTQVSLSNDIKEKRGKFKYPKNQEIVDEYFFNRKLLNNINIANKLAAIKYQIINGNLEKAKVLLLQAKYTDDFSKSIQFRYLGIIHFIEGNYKSSQEFLTKKEMYQIQNTSKICLLRTLNYVILENIPNAKLEWNRCVDATVNKSPTNHVWMTTLLKLKMNDEANITKVPFKAINIENEEGNFLRLYLKLSLYLNQQQKVLKRIPLLTIEAYQDEEIRELIGLLYYREGKLTKAYNFIEDLESPNSENIKGNLYLAQKKYELAYAQFKLALNRKVNSQNSLERIIPVAWLLNQWDDGLKYIEKLEVTPKDKFKKLAVKAAFETHKKDFEAARKTLTQIVVGSRNSQSPEVNQLFTYTALMLKDKHTTQDFASKSCANKDGLSCWLQYHLTLWEDFSQTIHRKDDIHSEASDLITQYSSPMDKKPIIEDLYIQQKDIEELDNELVDLQSEF